MSRSTKAPRMSHSGGAPDSISDHQKGNETVHNQEIVYSGTVRNLEIFGGAGS